MHRDENTNELSITAYDKLYAAAAHTLAELDLNAPYTMQDVAAAIGAFLGLAAIKVVGVDGNNPFTLVYPEGANVEGTENLRDMLNAIAEATQTIYYIDAQEHLVFKRLDVDGAELLTITKADYTTLDSKTNRRLVGIVSATELGDNIGVSLEQAGTTQYIRNNPFWELRDDLPTLLEDALAAAGGLTINQYDCSWRGNPALELADKISLEAKDGSKVSTYLLNDTIEYTGGLSQKSSWSYTESEAETESNPTSIGEAIKYTYAKVDKTEQEITMVAGEVSSIKLTTDAITTSVSKMDEELSTVATEVSSKMSAEDVNISIQVALNEGVDRVTTTTGFTFNEEGLHISKSGSEITTTITENGMQVYRDNKEVLVADNQGVKAEDLHATTFLIIGNNSRLEDYSSGKRTGCFWIKK